MIPQSLSQRIDTTRLGMILAVISIHCNILPFISDKANAIVTISAVKFLSCNLPAIGVPFFFFISAYLLQTKHPYLSIHSYFSLCIKRCRTVFLPYLLWNTIATLIRIIVNLTPLSRYTSGGPKFDSFLDMLVNIYWTPALEPLWFLRNLMGFIILVPVLQKILKLSPILLLIIGIFIENYTPLSGIIYFVFGMAVAQWYSPERFEQIISKLASFALFYVFVKACITFYPINTYIYPIFDETTNLIGLLGFMALCSKPLRLKHFDLPGAIFFVYAFHGIISPYVLKIMLLIYDWHGELWLIDYIISFLLTTTLSFATYHFTVRYCPQLSMLMTGNR